MQEIKRIDYIDILRSVGILLMVAGHVGFGNAFDYYIHAFHMPMFYIISGYLYKNKNIKFREFVIKKIRSLIIPYLIFGIFHEVIIIFIGIVRNDVNILSDMYHLLLYNHENMPIAGGLWFLTSLFFMDILIYCLEKLVNIWLKYSCIIFLVILGYVIPFYTRLPLSMDTALVGVGLFYIGKYMHETEIGLRSNRKLLYCSIAIIIGSILAFVNGYVNVRQGIYSNLVLFFIVSFLMTYGMLVVCQKFNLKGSIAFNELKFIGRNTMVYVCLNQILILLISKPLFMLLTIIQPIMKENVIVILILKICILISVCVILHILTSILNRRNLKFIIGK